MSQDVKKDTNAPEVKEEAETTENKATEEVKETTKEEAKKDETSEKKEQTIGELHKDTSSEKPKQVPIERLDKEIQKRKELERQLEEIKSQMEDEDEDPTPAEETKVDKLQKEIEQLKNKEAQKELDAVINKNIDEALKDAPEYKDIINRDVIARLIKDPANKDKTYLQVLDEAYGNAIGGKRTIETTTPRGGAEKQKVDMARAKKDPAYRKEVLKDPDLRKQYNEAEGGLENRLRL